MKAKGSQLLRHVLQNCIAVELYCVLVFDFLVCFFILKYGTPMRNTEQDALSRVVQNISLFFNKSFLIMEMMGKWLKEKKKKVTLKWSFIDVTIPMGKWIFE